MLEMNGHPRLPSGDLEQRLVEPMSRDRVDQFVGPLSVRLKGSAALGMMNEPSAHRQQRLLEIPEHSRQLQGVNAAVRQCQIDGSARFCSAFSGIGAAFVKFHGMAAALQQNCKQRPGGTRTDDANRGALRLHRRSASDRASTAANTSLYELYSGMGASRSTSGSRQSATTPAAVSRSWQRLAAAGGRAILKLSWQPRSDGASGVMMSTSSGSRAWMRCCKYAVRARDFSRSRCMPAR